MMETSARFRAIVSIAAIAALSACSGIDSDEELAQALANAEAGDVITLEAGTFTSSFTIPAGVTLSGAGRTQTTISTRSGVALDLRGGSGTTRVEDLRIESAGAAAIVVRPDGQAVIEDVDISASLGIGIGAEGVRSLTLSRCDVQGSVSDETAAGEEGTTSAPATSSTHGIILISSTASFEDVMVRGWASFGALVLGSNLSWSGGGVSGTLSTGVLVSAGSASLSGLVVEDIWRGMRLVPSYGVVGVEDASVTLDGVMLQRSTDYGVLQNVASFEVARSEVNDNGSGGHWVQDSVGTRIVDCTFDANGYASVLAVDSRSVAIEDTVISNTRLGTRVLRGTGFDVGDGIALTAVVEDVTIARTTLANNERAGFLWHLAGLDAMAVQIEDVVVDGTGEMYGAVAQVGVAPVDWDMGIERRGATIDNDAALSDPLDIIDGLAPSDLPILGAIETSGLAAVGIIMPMD